MRGIGGVRLITLWGRVEWGPASDPTAVVDDTLKVRGIESLRVIDASIMPSMLSANLNAGTMMIAEKELT